MKAATDSPLSQSLVDRARRAPKLSREEERDLIARWQENQDRDAVHRLTECHLRYVVAAAFKYRNYQAPTDVLISEGCMGLVRALDKFDLRQEVRFATYANYWIRYCITDHIMRSWSLVGGGSGALNARLFFRLRRERARVNSLFGSGDAADNALAKRLELPISKLHQLSQQLDYRDLSLNLPTHDDASSTLMDNLFVDPEQETALARSQAMAQLRPLLQHAVAQLSEREKLIVEHRLMADRDDEQSLSELGQTLGLSRERVRQIEKSLKHKLRAAVRKHTSTDSIAAA